MNIIQITPKLPPAIDGIGDYALELAEGLSKSYGISTHFLTLKQQTHHQQTSHFAASEIPAQTCQAFLESLPKDIDKIILHYSDFPYDQKYASPSWLLKGLTSAKQQRKIKLILMFHEFPFAPTLSKKLYLFPFQSRVAWQLAEIADVVFTNNSVFKNALEKRLRHPVFSIPVFSNVGEPLVVPPLEQRIRRLLVFGTPARRARIYQKSFDFLVKVCQTLQIEEIYDLGDSLTLNVEIDRVRLVEMGRLSAAKISELMLNSLAGIAYSNDNKKLAKSGVFASYCAHGLVPIITCGESAVADGIIANQHFFFPEGEQKNVEIDEIQVIGDHARAWYNTHNKAKTVEMFATQLLDMKQVALVSTSRI